VSLSAYAHFNLTLSLDGSRVVHCNPLSAGAVLVGHCGDVLVFSVLRTIGIFSAPQGAIALPPPVEEGLLRIEASR